MTRGASVQRVGDAVRVAGDLTLDNAAQVLEEGTQALSSAQGEQVFDLSGLRDCDSAALAVLLEWRRRAAAGNRQLVFRGIPERLRQLAGISEIDSLLN